MMETKHVSNIMLCIDRALAMEAENEKIPLDEKGWPIIEGMTKQAASAYLQARIFAPLRTAMDIRATSLREIGEDKQP